MNPARNVVLLVSADHGLCDAIDRVVARARCESLRVRDGAAAKSAIERARPVLILVDPRQRDEISAAVLATALVVELPVRTSSTGVRRLAKATSESVKWLSGLIADRCAAAS